MYQKSSIDSHHTLLWGTECVYTDASYNAQAELEKVTQKIMFNLSEYSKFCSAIASLTFKQLNMYLSSTYVT